MMEPPAYFDPPQLIQEVVLVGCGGTGSQIARSLGRIVYDLKRRRQHAPTLKFVDPDRVEMKNVGRQLFAHADAHLNTFKAESLARRFNYSLGLDIVCYNEPFSAEKHASSRSLVCGAVDNHLARRELARVDGLILECGNHVDSGQIVLGNTDDLDRVTRGLHNGRTHYLPTFALLFPTLLELEPCSVSKLLLQNDKESSMESYTYDPPYRFTQIVVVGLGGTGSQVARCLARLLYHQQQKRQHIPKVLFVDPDIIEPHNVGRQMFTPAEIGQPKAAILARRFNLALGLQIAAYCEPIDSQQHLPHGSLVCGCVDNHLARAEIARGSGFVWVDAGNGYDFGQVVVGDCGDTEQVRRGLRQTQNGSCHHLPHAGVLFPALLQPEPDTPPTPPLSCGELVMRDEQHLFINDFVATTTAQYLYRLLNREPLTTFATFLTLTPAPSVKSLSITSENLNAYLLV